MSMRAVIGTVLTISLLMMPMTARADDWDDFVDYMTTQEGMDAETLAGTLEALEQIHLAPININNCTHVDLEQISILTAEQVADLVFYVAKVEGMKTLGELIYVSSIDYMTRRWLPLFVYVGDYPTARRRLRFSDSRHEVLTRIDIPLYERKGYATDDARHRYQGSRIAHNLRYKFALGDRVAANLVLDKDQGEPVGRPCQLGYDFGGGNVMLKNMGWLNALIVGDYQVGFGEGLLMNQRFAMGKSVQRMGASNAIAAKTSTGETNYMRGLAATIGLTRGLTLSAFFSYNLKDATVVSGTSMASSLSTVTTHRNEVEMARRQNTSEMLYGAHVGWTNSMLRFGATGYRSHYHLPFYRGVEPYREFYPEGDVFWGASVDYGLRLGRWNLTGETATNGSGVATLNRLIYRHNARFSAQAAYRYYSPRYHSFHSNALAEWGVQNETGGYLQVDAQPLRQWQLTFSADLFHSPHVRYGIDHATTGEELRLSTTYTFSQRHSLTACVAWKHREQYNIMHSQQRYKIGWDARFGAFDLRTHAQLSHYSDAAGKRSLGYTLQETVRWSDRADRLRLALSAAWFQTDDYDGRVYLTEPTLVYGQSSTMLYGRGVRLAATARINLPYGLMVMLRYTFSRYLDRNTIGSDLQQIAAPWQNDLSVQVRWKI